MASLPWSTQLRTVGAICIDVLPETLVTSAMGVAGAEWFWPLGVAAVVPAAVAVRSTVRSVRDARRWEVTRWLVAEQRWQHEQRRNTAGQLESSQQPLIVDGTVIDTQGEVR